MPSIQPIQTGSRSNRRRDTGSPGRPCPVEPVDAEATEDHGERRRRDPVLSGPHLDAGLTDAAVRADLGSTVDLGSAGSARCSRSIYQGWQLQLNTPEIVDGQPGAADVGAGDSEIGFSAPFSRSRLAKISFPEAPSAPISVTWTEPRQNGWIEPSERSPPSIQNSAAAPSEAWAGRLSVARRVPDPSSPSSSAVTSATVRPSGTERQTARPPSRATNGTATACISKRVAPVASSTTGSW